MGFDIKGARDAGYTDDQIADFLAEDQGIDVAAARAAGYTTPKLLAEFESQWARKPLPAGVQPSTAGAGRGGQGGPTAAQAASAGPARRGTMRNVAPYAPYTPEAPEPEAPGPLERPGLDAERTSGLQSIAQLLGPRAGDPLANAQAQVDDLRNRLAAYPVEQRLTVARQLAERDDVIGRAARVVALDAGREAGAITPKYERQAAALGSPNIQPKATGGSPAGSTRTPVRSSTPMPDVTPNMGDLSTGATPAEIGARRAAAGVLASARTLDGTAQEDEGYMQRERDARPGALEGTALQGVADVVTLPLAAGTAQVLQLGVDSVRMLPDVIVGAERRGMLTDVSSWLSATAQDIRAMGSREMKADAAGLSRVIQDERTSVVDVLGYLAARPKLIAAMTVESAPSMAGAAVGGVAAGSLVERLALRALSAAPQTAAVTARIAELRTAAAGAGAIGSEAMMGAAGVYDEVRRAGGSDADAQRAAGLTAIGYALIGRAGGGGAEAALATGRRGVLAVGGEEAAQELGQSFTESAAKAEGLGQQLDVGEALKQGAVEAAVGGVSGAATGALPGPRQLTPQQEIAEAIRAGVDGTHFQRSGIEGYAARAGNSKFYDPTFIDPRNTAATPGAGAPAAPTQGSGVLAQATTAAAPAAAAPVRMEDMPGEVMSAEQAAQLGQQAAAARAQREAEAQAAKAAPTKPTPIGVSATPQGVLAARAEQLAPPPPIEQPAAPLVQGASETAERDPMLAEAVKVVLDTGSASVNTVQRHFRIGFNRAARMLEQMERDGVVSPMGSDGMRQVLGTKAPAAPLAPETTQAQAEEWHRFPAESGTLAVPRAEMPQIDAAHHGAFVNFLAARGVTSTTEEVDPRTLKPTQAEYSPQKAATSSERAGGRSVLVSSDGHVLDGHHLWLSTMDDGRPVKVMRLSAPIDQLLKLGREFPSSTTAPAAADASAPQAEAAPAPQAATAEQAPTEPEKAATPTVYTTKAQADAARRELGNTFKRQQVKGGFILRQMTDAELAAADKAGRRAQAAGNSVDTQRDSLLQAIAKLGGLERTGAQRDLGVKTDDLKRSSGVFGRPIFRATGGAAPDVMLADLKDRHYLPADADLRALEDAIGDELGGRQRFSMERDFGADEQPQSLNGTPEDAEDYDPFAGVDDDFGPLSDLMPDDLADAGYTALDPAEQAMTERLLAEAETAGVDTEELRERVAMATEGATDAEYHQALRVEIVRLLQAGSVRVQRADARAASARPEGDGRTVGQEGAGQEGDAREGLTLEAQSPADLKAKAAREEAAAAAEKAKRDAEQARLKRADDQRDTKARADETVDRFELGQSAEQQMSGMGDLFADAPPPAAARPPADRDKFWRDLRAKSRKEKRRPDDVQLLTNDQYVSLEDAKAAAWAAHQAGVMDIRAPIHYASFLDISGIDHDRMRLEMTGEPEMYRGEPVWPQGIDPKTWKWIPPGGTKPGAKAKPAATKRRSTEAGPAADLSVDLRAGPDTLDRTLAQFTPASAEHKALAERFAASIHARFGAAAAAFRAVGDPVGAKSPNDISMTRVIARRLFAKDVVFVEFQGRAAFAGAAWHEAPGVVFLNARMTHRPPMMVLGHELLHRLAKDRPTIYRELVARLMKQVQNGNDYFEQLSARYEAGGMSTKQVRFGEELIADIVGDFFGDPQFWRDMKAEQPTLFVRLVDWVLRFLDGVIARMRGIKTENIDAYVKDVEQARAAVVSAMRAYSREMTAQEPAAAVDGVLMGRQLGGSGVDLAKAWHGTPHRGIQKFSTDKIGTGEGAQAFGWGLYFSSRREIADWYRRNLTRAPDSIALDGQVFPSLWAGVQAGAFTDDERRLMDDYELADAIASLNFSEAIEAFRAAPYDAEDRRAVKALADRLSKPTPDQLSVGQLYEVDMPEDGELLLWDKPLGEQPAKVRESVRRMLGDVPRDWLDDALERLNADEIELTGQDIYHLMQRAVRDDALVPNTGTAAEQAVIDGADDKAASLLLAEDGIKGIKYLDGTSRGAGGGAHNYVIFSGDDVTIEGTHFSVGGDIALSVGQPGQFELRKFGAAAKTIEAIQDRYNRWKQAIADVRKQGGKITEENDFYRTEERYWGVVGSQLEDFRANELLPLVKAVAADGLTLDQVAEYAYAEHAPYRNKWIADKRPDMPDGGSGMTDADAAAIISAAAANGTEQALQRHAQALRDMAAGTRDTLRDNGLISDDEHAAWSALPYYVPLRGIDGDTGAHAAAGTARGFNIRGKEAKEARGRKSRAKDILENIANDRARALVRAGKNEVLRSFLAFVMDNPSPNLWEVNAVQRKPLWTTDDQGNRVLVPEKSLITDQSTVAVKDGGRIIYIRIKDQRLLEQLQGLNNEQVTLGIGALLWANRQLSRLYTSLSPVFVVMNAIRDLWGASVGMIDEVGFMGAARLWSSLPGAAVHAWNAEVRGKNSPAYDEFRHSGGKTGFMDLKSIDDQAAELGRLMRRASRSAWNPMGWLPALMTLIENINAFVENTTRFAAFRAARASGLTLARSASISKNITVNFNRRGTMTPFLGAFSLFFNPAVQGSMRVAQALSNPKTLATLSTGAVGIFMLALQNASMGEDDDGVAWWDKIPADVKERNLVIVLPAGAAEGEPVKGSKVGRYIKIPMPYGYNFFAVAANELADVMRHQQDPRRGRDMAGAGLRLMKAFTGSWVPMREVGDGLGGEPESFLQAAVPDALGPFGQIWANRSAFGRTLRPEDRHNANMPDSTKAFPGQVGTIWHQSAEWLNTHTGGSQFREGLIDVAPSTIETLVRGYGGGLVSVPLDIMNAMYVRQSISREAVRADALPLRKQLLGVIDAETDRSLGYERLEKAEEGVEKISAARKAGNREEVKRLREDFAEVERLGGQVQMTRDRLAYLRKRELAIISSDKPDAEKFARLQVLAVDHRVALQRFNAAFDKARAAPAKRLAVTTG